MTIRLEAFNWWLGKVTISC